MLYAKKQKPGCKTMRANTALAEKEVIESIGAKKSQVPPLELAVGNAPTRIPEEFMRATLMGAVIPIDYRPNTRNPFPNWAYHPKTEKVLVIYNLDPRNPENRDEIRRQIASAESEYGAVRISPRELILALGAGDWV